MINYTPFGFSDWQTEVSKIKAFGSAGKKTAVVSTINGDANVPFYKELGNQGIKATDIPVVAFSVGEEELAGLDTKPLVGHLAAWNYFESIKTPENEGLHQGMARLHQEPEAHHQRPDGSALHRLQHVGEGGREGRSTDPDKVIDALPGTTAPNLTGGISTMLPNHHITKPVFIGEIRPTASSTWCGRPKGLVPGAAWSPYLPGSKDLVGRLGEAQVRQLQHRNEEVRRRVVTATPKL
jgi:urea transport system substrate-binding protein